MGRAKHTIEGGMKSALRMIALVAVVVAVAFGYVHLAEQKGYALKKGAEAPGFRLPSLQGEQVDLASYAADRCC